MATSFDHGAAVVLALSLCRAVLHQHARHMNEGTHTQEGAPGICFNSTEADERNWLVQVLAAIRAELDRSNEKVGASFADVIELKQYLQDSKADMDHVEKIHVRQTIEQLAVVGDHRVERNRQLSRLLKAPYFGRIDFQSDGRSGVRPIYVGIHTFHDTTADRHLVHDWRAPISSMFYDFEIGPAHFDSPEGRARGALLTLKRQYRIENGRMVFMLETSLNIHDDVLQQELSRASSEKMRTIVATIQRDQNAIIRNDAAHTLIIQGAAGSGKTSIALHRIAYLLYRFKDSIRAEDVLIISPNRVFGHYISNVLRELGLGEKSILGDRHQAVNPYGSSDVERIREAFRGAECMVMNKSCRSTILRRRFARGYGWQAILIFRPAGEDEPRSGELDVENRDGFSTDFSEGLGWTRRAGSLRTPVGQKVERGSDFRRSFRSLRDVIQKCLRANSRPEPVLRYFSKARALVLEENRMTVSIRHGRCFAVCGTPPSLCFCRRLERSVVQPV